MSMDAGRKRGIGVGLRLVPVERTPREWLDLEFREAIVGLPVPAGKRRPRRFYKVGEGERHPMRVPARLLDDAMASRVAPELVIGAITRALTRYVARKRRVPVQSTGEYPQLIA